MHNVNVPLLRKTLEHITAHPEEWDQTSWARKLLDESTTTEWIKVDGELVEVEVTTEFVKASCRTACCLAGTAVQFAGYEIDWEKASPNCECDECGGGVTADYVKGGRSIEHVAGDELGLDDDQANALFSADNSLPALWAMASEFTDGEIEVPEAMQRNEPVLNEF